MERTARLWRLPLPVTRHCYLPSRAKRYNFDTMSQEASGETRSSKAFQIRAS